MNAEYLFKLRLVVGRVGEMDLAKWWNTKGQLGSLGASVLRRGFPRTHRFAQARSVFAVASARCADVYSPRGAVTLWNLPAELEDEVGQRWEPWIEEASHWEPFFKELEVCSDDVQAELLRLELVSSAHVDEVDDKMLWMPWSRASGTNVGHLVSCARDSM
ncbi:MAG TPA: BrxE family protein [Ilumatobacter sp.]|nr:BrxE family protein [Ilumatobacter sp.]